MGGSGIFGWLGDALFGASPYVPTQTAGVGGGITPTPAAGATSLGGLLDPRGIREQAFYQGLGSLSQGLLAAGLPHPATQGSLIPQALGAFQPAYSGALSQGYQQAAADQQIRQQQQDDQAIAAYRQANPAAANLTRAAVIAQMSRTPPANFELDPTRPGGVRPIQGGPADLSYAEALARAQRDPNVTLTQGGLLVDRATGRTIASVAPAPHYERQPNGDLVAVQPPPPVVSGGMLSQTPGQQPPQAAAPGTQPGLLAQPPAQQPPLQPGQAPTAAGSSAPLGMRANNPLNLGGEDAIRAGRFNYATPEDAIAASVRQITLNQQRAGGSLTPTTLAQSWIRPSAGESPEAFQQRVQGYGRRIATALQTDPNQPLNLADAGTMARVIGIMAQVEQGRLPQGYDAVIARGVQQGFQPGPISPSNPTRMYSGAGGAGPRAQPAMPGTQAAASPPPAAAQPPAMAPPMAAAPATRQLPGGGTVTTVIPNDPTTLTGGIEAQMYNIYRMLDAKRASGQQLTPQEQQDLAIAERHLTMPRIGPDGTTMVPGPLPSRQGGAAASPPAAAPTAVAPAPGGAAPPAPPATAAPAPGQRGEPPVPAGMYRTRNATGGYTDRPLQEQPAAVVTSLMTNAGTLSSIDRTLAELDQRERSVGVGPGALARFSGDTILQRTDPEGSALRAQIANLRSMIIHERSGAATSVGEMAVLRPFLPDISDNADTIRTKLANLREQIGNITGGMYEAYGPTANYRPLPQVDRVLNPPNPLPGSFRQTPYLPNGELDRTSETGVRTGQIYQLNMRDGTQAFGRWVQRPGTGGMERTAGFEPVIWQNGRWVARPEAQ